MHATHGHAWSADWHSFHNVGRNRTSLLLAAHARKRQLRRAHDAATALQSLMRGRRARHNYLHTLSSIVRTQRRVRLWMFAFEVRRVAALRITVWAKARLSIRKMCQLRRYYLESEAAQSIQNAYRKRLAILRFRRVNQQRILFHLETFVCQPKLKEQYRRKSAWVLARENISVWIQDGLFLALERLQALHHLPLRLLGQDLASGTA